MARTIAVAERSRARRARIRWRNSSAACSTMSAPASGGRSGAEHPLPRDADRRGHRVGKGSAAGRLQAGLRSGSRGDPFPRSVGAVRIRHGRTSPSPPVRAVPAAHHPDACRFWSRAIASSLVAHLRRAAAARLGASASSHRAGVRLAARAVSGRVVGAERLEANRSKPMRTKSSCVFVECVC